MDHVDLPLALCGTRAGFGGGKVDTLRLAHPCHCNDDLDDTLRYYCTVALRARRVLKLESLSPYYDRKWLTSRWETFPARFPFRFVSVSSCQQEAEVVSCVQPDK